MKNTFHQFQSKNILNRKRIHRLYHESIGHNIISIIAGPGYGKTQSVMSFVSELDAQIVWIPFSRLDNYTIHFWENFYNAFQAIDEKFRRYCMKIGFPNDAGTMYHFLRQFQTNINTDKPLLFVFDDCHLIEENAVCIFIYNLIKSLAGHATAFFMSRTICHLNAEHNLQGTSVKVIDERMLTFSAEETAEYFQLMNLDMPSTHLSSIYKKTEGWPIALYMLALYGRKNPEAVTASPQLNDDLLLTMIGHEIFSHCTPEDQKLLLKLSLLDFLPARYVEEVYGKEALIHIASNLLVRYNAHSNSYSLHQLLKDFLKQRTDNLEESEIRSTYRTAAEWFMKYDLKIDALHCYEYLEDEQHLWHIVWDTMIDSRGPSRELLDYFHNILKRLEQSPSFHNNWLPVAKAIYYSFTAEFDLAEKGFRQVIDHYSAQPGMEELVGEACLNLALIRMLHGDIEFCRYFREAQKLLLHGSITQTSGRMIVLNGDTIILRCGAAGELSAWIEAHRQNSEVSDLLLHNAMHGMADLVTAQAYYYCGDMAHAEQFALKTLHYAREKQCIDIVGNTYYLLEKICMHRGDYANAQNYIETSYAYMEQYNDNPHYNLPEIAEGYFLMQIGRGDLMKDWIINESIYHKSLLSTNYGLERLLKGQYLLADQRYQELFVHLNYTRKVYERSHRFIALIYTHLLYCFAYLQSGDTVNAVSSFETAYQMAVPNDIIMPFVEMGHYIRDISSLIRSESALVSEDWMNTTQAKAAIYGKRISILQNEYRKVHADHDSSRSLTAREKKLIILASQGLLQSELAEEMHVSVNTVKGIQKSIHAKLGASNSAHAMYIAMKDHLIE